MDPAVTSITPSDIGQGGANRSWTRTRDQDLRHGQPVMAAQRAPQSSSNSQPAQLLSNTPLSSPANTQSTHYFTQLLATPLNDPTASRALLSGDAVVHIATPNVPQGTRSSISHLYTPHGGGSSPVHRDVNRGRQTSDQHPGHYGSSHTGGSLPDHSPGSLPRSASHSPPPLYQE